MSSSRRGCPWPRPGGRSSPAMARRPSASAGDAVVIQSEAHQAAAILLHQGEGMAARLLAVHGVDEGLAVVPPQGGLHGLRVGGVQLQGQAGDGLEGLHRLGEHRRLVQPGQAHVHVQDVGPGLLLLEGLVQHIVHVPGPEGGLELLFPSGVDALPMTTGSLPSRATCLAVGGDEQGVLPGDLRQGRSFVAWIGAARWGGGGAAASPGGWPWGQSAIWAACSPPGSRRRRSFPLTRGRPGLGGGDRGGCPQLAEHRGHFLGAQAAVETDDVHPSLSRATAAWGSPR